MWNGKYISSATSGECIKAEIKSSSKAVVTGKDWGGDGCYRPAPLMRSRTLPAIVVPGLSILQKQIDARYTANAGTNCNQI